jgi:hypothetical protein
MDKPLSISGYKRWHLCPKYYEYYDVEGDRPPANSSPLIIGTVVDEVVMAKLTGNDLLDFRDVLAPYKKGRTVFKEDDMDLDFVDTTQAKELAKACGWKGKDINKALKDFIKNQTELSDNQYEVLALAAWQSIEVKIDAMLTAFDKWIRPKIKRVISVQEHLDDGKTHGYLDFVAETTDGKTVLFDLKTAKTAYDKQAVLYSPQLSLYASMRGADYAGYIVLVKSLSKNKEKWCEECNFKETGGNRKKCPTHKTELKFTVNPTSYAQYLVDPVSDYNKELTTTAMYETIKCIDNGVFPRNLNTCKWVFGEPCPYLEKCWRNK